MHEMGSDEIFNFFLKTDSLMILVLNLGLNLKFAYSVIIYANEETLAFYFPVSG